MELPNPTTSVNGTEQLSHLTTLTHEGKVVVFAAAERAAGQSTEIYYTVRRDGFENRTDSATGALPAWENWKKLPLLDDDIDQSVLDDEKKTLSVQGTS